MVAVSLFDTHCHIDVEEFNHDREHIIQLSHKVGITKILVPGIKAQTWPGLLQTCQKHTGLYSALGLHPVYLNEHQPDDLIRLKEYIALSNPVAIGEIGLDYLLSDLDHNKQLWFFEQQLEIAQSLSLPVILHVRKAHDQVITTLNHIKVVGGIVHAFNGSIQHARQYQQLGFMLGFGGTMTFEHSRRIRSLAKQIPLDTLVLETDAPDMSPQQHRGERNSPHYLLYSLEALASIKEMPESEIALHTWSNACRVLNIGNS